MIFPHFNPESEPFKPCLGCHSGKIRRKLLQVECWECGGEGWVDDDDWMWNDKGWQDCYQCYGRGYVKLRLRYCDEECYYASHSEDF